MPIPLGENHEENLQVTEEMAISFLGPGAARVLSTPHLIGFLEMTSRNLIKTFVEPGEDSVGTLVNIRHLAATPIGMHVRLRAEIVSVEGRRVMCKVDAWDDREKIGEGTHERFVIDVARFGLRVRAKSAGQ
ncbi:MAG: thioesterase family protein [Bryobacteraceae bacterium]|jgi:predicted thioesterase